LQKKKENLQQGSIDVKKKTRTRRGKSISTLHEAPLKKRPKRGGLTVKNQTIDRGKLRPQVRKSNAGKFPRGRKSKTKNLTNGFQKKKPIKKCKTGFE